MKLGEALEIFLTGTRTEVGSKQTVIWYRKRLKRLVSFFDDCEINCITLDDLRRFVASLQDQNIKYQNHKYHKPVAGALSASTIHGYVRSVKTFYNWLMENGHIDLAHNAAIRLKKPKLPKQAPKAITENDMLAVLKASRNYGRYAKRNFALLMVLAETGCRVGGLVNLRVGDIDLQQSRGLVTEKGNKTRAIFFNEITKSALGAWIAERPQDTDYLFTGERGRLTDWGVRMLLRNLARVAGVKGRVNPHSFRHAFARRHLNNGGDIGFLSDLMGHSNIKVTKDAYSIFEADELQRKHREFSSLDKLLSS